MSSWIKRHAFPLLLGLGLAFVRLLVIADLLISTSPGFRWLGDTILNPSDQAVYLAQIRQVAEGANGLTNLFAAPGQVAFFHPMYVPLGWIVRLTHLSPIFVHEVAAILGLLLMPILLHAVSRGLAEREQDARLATLLVVISGGFGWAILTLGQVFGFATPAIPDLATETFFAPTVLMAVHIPVSFALLPFALFSLWKNPRSRQTLLAVFSLLLIHPYFAPLIGLFGIVCFFCTPQAKILHFFPVATATVLALLPSLWMVALNPSRQHFLSKVIELPLAPWYVWLFATLPWLILITWRRKTKTAFIHNETFLLVWFACVAVTLLLPFNWPRKLMQATGAGLIWLAMPSVLRLKTHLRSLGRIFPATALIIASLSPIFLLKSQFTWTHGTPTQRQALYLPTAYFEAYQWIHDHTAPDAVAFPTSITAGLWTPAFASRSTWIGHPFETPDFQTKRTALLRTLELQDPRALRLLVEQSSASIILSTATGTTAFLTRALDPAAWQTAATFDDLTVLTKRRPSEEIGARTTKRSVP